MCSAVAVESNILIEAVDANDAPAPAPPVLSRNTLPEDSVAGTLIGVLSASDQDAGQAIAFTLVGGAMAVAGRQGKGLCNPGAARRYLFLLVCDYSLVYMSAPFYYYHKQIHG